MTQTPPSVSEQTDRLIDAEAQGMADRLAPAKAGRIYRPGARACQSGNLYRCGQPAARGDGSYLLHGPPGLGKTTMAQIIANELGVGFRATSGPVIARQGIWLPC